MLPTQVLDRPQSEFDLISQIMNAGVEWENEQRKEAGDGNSAGSATPAEKSGLVQRNEARADQREARDGSGPSIEEQRRMARGG